ncbi:hypothetical protein EYF80_019177 [Liparis tanakae]|uniref:Uncharacterized protein n=1 Tax=Liparis tanakae TaxID=230148 RepID=A0A4Z2I037_9TELE|nr:hypothetical protein EYF80_019177 [Liparis tanakae]
MGLDTVLARKPCADISLKYLKRTRPLVNLELLLLLQVLLQLGLLMLELVDCQSLLLLLEGLDLLKQGVADKLFFLLCSRLLQEGKNKRREKSTARHI